MSINLFTGRSQPGASVDTNYRLVQELMDRFSARFGSIHCHDLVGCDLGTDAGQAFFRSHNMIEQCLQYAEEATQIAMTLLEPHGLPADSG